TFHGLALLDVATVLEPEKELTRVSGHAADGLGPVSGYEMHLGHTTGSGADRPAMTLAGAPSGAISADGKVMGVYLHGLFTNDTFRHNFLGRIKQRPGSGVAYEKQVSYALDQLATAIESHLDMEALLTASR
ncbi:MAG: cobyric acid synthase CobQ, partial [Rhodospirillales bacterium]|nr:cobyric acid synthase CobQ [Rhodospirillales bacterium]